VLKLWWLDQLWPLATGSAPTGFLGEAASSLGIGAQQLADASVSVSLMKKLAYSIHEQFRPSEGEYVIIANIVKPIAEKHTTPHAEQLDNTTRGGATGRKPPSSI
jgi:hypothetical protein